MVNVYPIFCCCVCGNLSVDTQGLHCQHTIGFSKHNKISSKYIELKQSFMMQCRKLHDAKI